MSEILHFPNARVRIEATDSGKHLVSVESADDLVVPTKIWETAYDVCLIEHILRVKGPEYLCDEIRRDEDRLYVQRYLHWGILSYVGDEAFAGRRILDFGSGSGASSIVLARMFPAVAGILGIEQVPEYIELAEHRARFHGVADQVKFVLSDNPKSLPPGIGEFDYIVLNAVHEHLLPEERQQVLPLLWSHLKLDGLLFMTETPYRWFPVEGHTTRLPFINYLPETLALGYARRFSKQVGQETSWVELLMRGIRGGTSREVLRILNRGERKAKLLSPSRLGVRDQIELWYRVSSGVRGQRTKYLLMWCFRVIKAMTSLTTIPSLSLAIQRIK